MVQGKTRGRARRIETEHALAELANALQTMVLSLEAHYEPPEKCHVSGEALEMVAQRIEKAAEKLTRSLSK